MNLLIVYKVKEQEEQGKSTEEDERDDEYGLSKNGASKLVVVSFKFEV